MPGQSKVDSTRSIVNLVAFLLVLNMTSNWLRWSWLRQALLLSLLPLTLVLLLSRTGGTLIKPTNTSTKDQQDEANIQGSVIVPAYHEALNMRPLVEQVFAALAKHGDMAKTTEIIIVDDNSRDGTVEAIESLKQEGYNVRVIVRTNENGLSSAVLRGFTEARGQNWVVMDADLQHPPSVVPEMLKALSTKPFALGTRYATGVQVDKDWGKIRRIISWGARSLARPLTSASDPMTGFFGLRKDLYLTAKPINPTGFKIALELLLKTSVPQSQIIDVPFNFSKRVLGESKLSSKVMVRYVFHLLSLYSWRHPILWPIFVEASLVAGIASVLYLGKSALAAFTANRIETMRRTRKRAHEV